jgi:hypothetical protein
MASRCLTFVLLTLQLASQLVLNPHVHAGQSSHDEHAWRPHIHFSGATHVHHVHTAPHRHVVTPSIGQQPVVESLDDHDHDAVYLPSVVQAPNDAAKVSFQVAHNDVSFSVGIYSLPPIYAEFLHRQYLARHEATPTGEHCALYLSIGLLRI